MFSERESLYFTLTKPITPYKRAYAARILLATFASLRFSDAQRPRSFEVNEASVRGTLLSCKTKKQSGQFRHWACPLQGVTGPREWAQPWMDMRQAYRKINGADPSFARMRLDRARELAAADAAPYSTARRKLALLRAAMWGAGRRNLHTPLAQEFAPRGRKSVEPRSTRTQYRRPLVIHVKDASTV